MDEAEKATILEILKEQGLDLAEGQLNSLVNGLFEALPKIVEATPNKYDDMLIPLLAVVKPALMKLIDSIDGQEG